jgi:hypothetical protein
MRSDATANLQVGRVPATRVAAVSRGATSKGSPRTCRLRTADALVAPARPVESLTQEIDAEYKQKVT